MADDDAAAEEPDDYAAAEPIYRKGPLKKLPRNTKWFGTQWQTRDFVLDGDAGLLKYYREGKAGYNTHLLGELWLEGAEVAVADALVKGRGYCFRLESVADDAPAITLSAEYAEERDEWVSALLAAIAAQGRERGDTYAYQPKRRRQSMYDEAEEGGPESDASAEAPPSDPPPSKPPKPERPRAVSAARPAVRPKTPAEARARGLSACRPPEKLASVVSATSSATRAAKRVAAHRRERTEQEKAACTFSPELAESRKSFMRRRPPSKSRGAAVRTRMAKERREKPREPAARLSFRDTGVDGGDHDYDADFLSGLLESYHSHRAPPPPPVEHVLDVERTKGGLPARPPASPTRVHKGPGGREAVAALAARALEAESEAARLRADVRGLEAEKRGFLRRVHAENATLARSLAAARAAAVAGAAARASGLDAALDGLPVADPAAGAPRDAREEYDLVELHGDVCQSLRALHAKQRSVFEAALRAARGAEEAAAVGDERAKERWLRALEDAVGDAAGETGILD